METLAERIDRREQIEALKQLKYHYCAAVDENYNAAAIAAMFTEDGIWDGGELGYLAGRDAIHHGFMETNSAVLWITHGVYNPIIEVTGDRALCRWYKSKIGPLAASAINASRNAVKSA